MATKGRPRKPITEATVRKCAEFMMTRKEIAAWLGVHRETLRRREVDEPAIKEAIEAGYEKAKASLRRVQFTRALAGDKTMLVWLGKQYLGQKDKQEVETRDLPSFVVVAESEEDTEDEVTETPTN